MKIFGNHFSTCREMRSTCCHLYLPKGSGRLNGPEEPGPPGAALGSVFFGENQNLRNDRDEEYDEDDTCLEAIFTGPRLKSVLHRADIYG